MNSIRLAAAALTACGTLWSQQPPGEAENAARMAAGAAPIYRVDVTERTAKAINYQHRGGATKIDFRGTSLLPGSRGEAKVESKQGYIEIEVEFDDLSPSNRLGSAYLTYVLWAITPEGRTANLGEVLLNGTKSKLNVTTELQVFGLVVTAEPYFAVTRPSDLIVMENVVRADTKGKIEVIDARYELLQRGQYQRMANPLELKLDPKVPLELYEARNAVQIARGMGADRFAAETFEKATRTLAEAEAAENNKSGRKPVTMLARQTVQTAEDARAIAVKRQEADALAKERLESANREADSETARAAAQAETERVQRAADAARTQAAADAGRIAQQNQAQAALAAAEADRLRAANERQSAEAQAAADRLRRENDTRMANAEAESNRLKQEAAAQSAAAQAALDAVAREKARLETEKVELRARLLAQFNAVLQTRDTARGLIVNMPDVLFGSGQYSLRPEAREKLARVVGILSGHPDLALAVEGHTDSVGSDSYNQKLSEQRGNAVRDYLTGGGLSGSSVTSRGLGETQPVATNDNAAGRQQNRRVELIISGEAIGMGVSAPAADRE